MKQFKLLIFALIGVTLVGCTGVLGNNKKSYSVQKNLVTYNVGYDRNGNLVKFSVPPYFLRYLKERGISPKDVGAYWLTCLNTIEDVKRGEVVGAEIIDENAIRIQISTAFPNRYVYTSKNHYVLTRMLISRGKRGYEARCLAKRREDLYYGIDR